MGALHPIAMLAAAARPALARPVRGSLVHQCRNVQQLTIQPNTGRVHVAEGQFGRHARSGHVATVFGCTGFLGRYVVSKLARQGTQVIVPYREQDDMRHLKVTGDLGQVVPMEWTLENDTQIEECLRHSDTVYNLVGRNYETKNYSFDDVNVAGARRIARIAAQNGVSRLIHVSHYNAHPDSTSAFYRTKAEGESAVREVFPDATIVKPSWMFGHEDRLLNTMASSPSVYRVNHGETVIKPVHALDVAQALATMIHAPSTIGETFVLPGPKAYSFGEMLALCEALTLKKLQGPNWPRSLLRLASMIWDNVWWPTVSPDEVKRRFINDLEIDAVKEGYKTFADLNIEPDTLENLAIIYLRRYRSSSYYDMPITRGGIKLRQPQYHAVE